MTIQILPILRRAVAKVARPEDLIDTDEFIPDRGVLTQRLYLRTERFDDHIPSITTSFQANHPTVPRTRS